MPRRAALTGVIGEVGGLYKSGSKAGGANTPRPNTQAEAHDVGRQDAFRRFDEAVPPSGIASAVAFSFATCVACAGMTVFMG